MGEQGDKPTVTGIRVPGGRVVRPETEWEFGDIARIADAHGYVWPLMLRSPQLMSAACQLDLYQHACKTAQVEVPSPLTAEIMADVFTQVPEDLPEEYGDGGVPKEDSPETT